MVVKKLVVYIALLAATAHAGAVSCIGVPKGVSLDGETGDVLVEEISPMRWARLCSIRNDANGITASVCKGYLSALLAAQASGRSVMTYTRSTVECGAHPPWQFLQGFYFLTLLN
ncbi:hypothetical protein V4F39_06925 [Aquincola sp. MAHUQ-54]|uniref:Uncharacterized protein n=1 Tax=Aquincola agrisoli TaxID=3119538 RepID=A0AAW9QDY9_9BURK